mgnify:CR=1 FL=1
MKKKLLCLIMLLMFIIGSIPYSHISALNDPFYLAATPGDNVSEIIIPKKDGSCTASVDFILTSKSATGFGEKITLVSLTNTSSGTTTNLGIQLNANDRKWSYSLENHPFRSIDAGKTIVFELDWIDSSGTDRKTSCEINIKAAAPAVSIYVDVDKTSVIPGGAVVIKYEVINTGNVPLSYVTILDEEITEILGKSYIYSNTRSNETLAVGGSIQESVLIELDQTVVSKPIVTYAYIESGQTEGKETTITVNEVVPELTLTCDNYSVSEKGEKHKFNYTIKNTSEEIDLTNIYVYDSDASNASVVYGPFTLAAGQSYSGSYEIPIMTSGFYKFKVIYSYNGSDEPKEISAKTEKAIKLPNDVSFTIESISPEVITEAGDVTFTLLIENGTASMLQNITITEENKLMDPVNIDVIIPAASNGTNGKLTKDVTVNIKESGTKLRFVLTYKIDGETSTLKTSYDIVFNDILTPPTATVAATEAPPTESKGIPTFVWILIGILVLILIATGIVLLILFKNRAAAKKNTKSIYRKINDDSFDENADFSETDSSEEYEDMNDTDYDDDSYYDDDNVKIYTKKK